MPARPLYNVTVQSRCTVQVTAHQRPGSMLDDNRMTVVMLVFGTRVPGY